MLRYKTILIPLSFVIFYFIGAVTVQYKLFPFPQIVKLRNYVKSPINNHSFLENNTYKLFDIYSTPKADIIMLGDSITYGVNWDELFNIPIVNRGIGGDTTTGFLVRLKQVIKLHPKKVFIMGGINDLARYENVDFIFSNYKKIIEKLKLNNITPYVQSTLYTNRKSLNKKVKKLNLLLYKHCKDNNIIFIDLNKKLSNNNHIIDKFSTDGVHLTASGYKIWKNEIYKYVSNKL